jgi:dTDP-4-dehydrorhamnose 3,5-epimerase
VQLRELSINGALEVTPIQRPDDRGLFLEWYRFDLLAEAVGHPLDLRQANLSVSRRGVLRGIHFADIPPGQAKYVTVTAGAIIDYVVDIRVGSPTFGEWDSVLLDDVDRRSLYIADGLGHAFVALAEGTVVSYLVSDTYRVGAEHGISPVDPAIGLSLPSDIGPLVMSDKDRDAPTLDDAMRSGVLPTWAAATEHYRSLNSN